MYPVVGWSAYISRVPCLFFFPNTMKFSSDRFIKVLRGPERFRLVWRSSEKFGDVRRSSNRFRKYQRGCEKFREIQIVSTK